jgi:2-keto-3-deoxy-L-rhamnonate aldolase RhmA
MRNPLKEKLQDGKVAMGTFVSIGHPDVTERLSILGFDWLLLDGEHGPLGFETMQTMMQSMRSDTCVPIVRVQWNDPVVIKRSLDIGAYGVLIPWINTKEEAEAAVSACKYPPQGLRGCGPRRAALVGGPDYIGTANDAILVAVQIETATAVKNIDDILAVDGVDTVYIGPTDLSMSMFGAPGKWQEPSYLEAFDTVLKAAAKAGKPAGMFANSGNIEWAIEKGFKFNSVDNDDGFLMAGARAALGKAQTAADKLG